MYSFKTIGNINLEEMFVFSSYYVNLKVSNHHSSNDGQINETQELKSLLDNADQRNQEQEEVIKFLSLF